jgi:hypothetical protein
MLSFNSVFRCLDLTYSFLTGNNSIIEQITETRCYNPRSSTPALIIDNVMCEPIPKHLHEFLGSKGYHHACAEVSRDYYGYQFDLEQALSVAAIAAIIPISLMKIYEGVERKYKHDSLKAKIAELKKESPGTSSEGEKESFVDGSATSFKEPAIKLK